MAFYAYRHRLPWLSTIGVKPSLRGASTDALSVAVTERLEEQSRKDAEARLREGRFLDPARKPATYCRGLPAWGYWVVWNGMMRFLQALWTSPTSPCWSRGFPAGPGSSFSNMRKSWRWPDNTKIKQCPFDIA